MFQGVADGKCVFSFCPQDIEKQLCRDTSFNQTLYQHFLHREAAEEDSSKNLHSYRVPTFTDVGTRRYKAMSFCSPSFILTYTPTPISMTLSAPLAYVSSYIVNKALELLKT